MSKERVKDPFFTQVIIVHEVLARLAFICLHKGSEGSKSSMRKRYSGSEQPSQKAPVHRRTEPLIPFRHSAESSPVTFHHSNGPALASPALESDK